LIKKQLLPALSTKQKKKTLVLRGKNNISLQKSTKKTSRKTIPQNIQETP
jgi:hypothetical protein